MQMVVVLIALAFVYLRNPQLLNHYRLGNVLKFLNINLQSFNTTMI